MSYRKRRRAIPASRRSASVLVIDDEPPIRKLLRMGLVTQGYEILEAPNGKTALDLLKEEPDVILLDLGLPDIDGHEILEINPCTKRIRSDRGSLESRR